MRVDNTLAPHGGRFTERVLDAAEGAKAIKGLTQVPVRGQIATECMGLAYGFFAPLSGFMKSEDVDGVAKAMRLASGYVWSVPILFDLSPSQIAQAGITEGQTIVLTYQGTRWPPSTSRRSTTTTSRSWPSGSTAPPRTPTPAC